MSATAQTTETPVPVKGGLVAYLMVDGAIKAADFYTKAFGAEHAATFQPDEAGRTMHVHLYVNGSSLIMSDPYPEHGMLLKGHEGFTMTLMVDDVDAAYKRAVDAGCEVIMPPENMFYGDRYAQVRDPFGVAWAFNGPQK